MAIYTHLLASDNFSTPITQTYTAGVAPQVAVITCMDFINLEVSPGHLLQGFWVARSDGTIIWANSSRTVRSNKPYHWEGRQVLLPDREFVVQLLDPFWHVSVTGYLLNPP